jgi:hypothetical protein
MKYNIQKLDGRFSYRQWFGYYIGFSGYMSRGRGPLEFNNALKWFVDTYGWSAEIRQYCKIHEWVNTSSRISMAASNPGLHSGILLNSPDHCNPLWSWTNVYDDLRIYVATDKELTFFQLANPQDAR